MSKRAMFSFRAFAALAAVLVCAQCSHAAPVMSGGIDDFSAIVEISRLPAAQQTPKIVQLYEWLPALYSASLSRRGFTELPPQLTPDEKQLSAKEQLMLAYPRGNWQLYVNAESYDLATQVLREHPDEVAALLLKDLRADDEKYQKRGLFNLSKAWPLIYRHLNNQFETAPGPIRTRWFEPIYAEVAHLFQRSPQVTTTNYNTTIYSVNYYLAPVKALAREALNQLGDARAISLFINDNAAQPAYYYLEIQKMTSDYPNDAGLQPLEQLLVSGDVALRYRALFALPTANAATRTALPILLGDADAKIRALAVSRAFELKHTEFENVKEQLKNILDDADVNVRLKAAVGFAKRGDAIAAPVLLKLWRDENSFLGRQANFGLANLMGESLDRLVVDDAMKPRRVEWRDAEAFARVEAWIAAHPAN